MKNIKTCYIAGPMRGIPYYNFPAFDAAAAHLKSIGIEPTNPADLDRIAGFDPSKLPEKHDWRSIPDGFSFQDCVTRDIDAVRSTDGIYLLDGWEKSTGARAEKALAEWLGKSVFYQTEPNQSGEVRITDPTTGGQKGVKIARFDLIPARPLWLLAVVYGKGAAKYSDDNWRKGYDWRLSFGALMRHAWAFWKGQDNDEETGLPHLAHAAWHCFTLIEFMHTHRDKDSRPK